jgi:hypothetical protein
MAKVWWYGYSAGFLAQMRGFVDLLFGRNYGRRAAGAVKALQAFRRRGRL